MQLAVTPDRRWEATTPELVDATAAAGFDLLGIGADDVGPDTAAVYRAARIGCHEVLALMLTSDAAEALSSAERLAAAASAVDAPWVLTVFRAPLDRSTARTIERCAAIFAESGAGMAVEFSPMGPIDSIDAGLEVVEVARRTGTAGLVIDSWHFCVGVSTWADLATVPLDDIAYVQFTDALVPESDDRFHETTNRRALPGTGVLELDRFSSTLRHRGFDGIVSLEVLSAELAALPVQEITERLHAATTAFWM